MRLDHYIRDTYRLTGNKAQQLIKEGYVSVNTLLIQKPAYDVSGTEDISLREEKRIHWVSRSAGKLDGFLEQIEIHEPAATVMSTRGDIVPKDIGSKISHTSKGHIPIQIPGANCLDVGASTGGFTQVLLERGAAHVDAVDVGTDQLHATIRDDARVASYEQMDIREFAGLMGAGLQVGSIPPHQHTSTPAHYDIIVCDASFISLQDILASILTLADTHTAIILLWKPQFEVGKSHLQPRGVPKDEKIVLKKMREWEIFLEENKCKISQKEKSTVIGEAGNEEWLYLIRKE